jgi:hypothetical protein
LNGFAFREAVFAPAIVGVFSFMGRAHHRWPQGPELLVKDGAGFGRPTAARIRPKIQACHLVQIQKADFPNASRGLHQKPRSKAEVNGRPRSSAVASLFANGHALVEYINRNVARQRRARIVQNPDRTFRINESLDDCGDIDLPPVPAPDDETKALIARLRGTVSGNDPTAWEAAVCDAFAHAGFRATHLGGHKAPDGYVDACLGPLGYRSMLECKTGDVVVPHPDVAEAAKWAEQYGAQVNALVGPDFPDETEFHSELLLHRVSAWTIYDVCTALEKRLDSLELRACFAPGYAGDAMVDVLWERDHGERKRVTFLAETIAREGWAAQVAVAEQADPANAPHLTIDAAMLLVQEQLTRAGATRACTRAEVQLAFEYLTNPTSMKAVWLDASRGAIVITRAPLSP